MLLERFLPAPPSRVLDVGGASGLYASWLSGRGYHVHLIDPVPLHREQATTDGRFSVAPGDARHLAEDDASYDAVLLLGPLYHLTERTDRVRTLAEARRVTRPGATTRHWPTSPAPSSSTLKTTGLVTSVRLRFTVAAT